MSFLLDTNVVSEIARARPDRSVLAWFKATSDERLYLSVRTVNNHLQRAYTKLGVTNRAELLEALRRSR